MTTTSTATVPMAVDGKAGGEACLTPEYMWAERKDTVHLTLNVPNPVEDTAACSLTPEGRVVWVGTGGPADTPHRYRLDIQLMGAVDVAAAKKAVGARAVVFRLPKATSGYWGKLTEKKDLHCRVDWSMWKDEDEEEEFDFGENWSNKDMGCLDYGDPANRDISSDSDDSDDEYSPGASPAAADAKGEPADEGDAADGAMADADGAEGKTDAPPAAAAAPTEST
ncbi:hypothetical protein BU14_0259s0012 [Porphyra umbilicalis]|uniref:CS domain-containing protein n=1 Tax=Porphyra umbilicalis TaxID=2786 RepID=A0A1X6P2G7_PORUM|nr:hypothetical protein BU14_0259s0012 [Porphyra umbilicalis]|eukprot:OSX74976.1 hypothetical protein BU14_0259s0012 [Porphyra umbilicalis]